GKDCWCLKEAINFYVLIWRLDILRRKKDYKDGKFSQVVSNGLDMKLRDDLERLKKIRNHCGLRHYRGLRVRGQHAKTTGRRGKTVGVSKKR
ncbi:hypothetical protein RYX36_025304, partial [Vicia faba]